MDLRHFELALRDWVGWVIIFVEVIGILIVLIGVSLAAYKFFANKSKLDPVNFHLIRLVLGRYLVLALEFQLGADILATAINPTWIEIGQLAAIAVIRTGLNYFLTKEISEEAEKKQEAENGKEA